MPRGAPAISTSSAWPSAPPTGAATTTSPNRSSASSPATRSRSRRGRQSTGGLPGAPAPRKMADGQARGGHCDLVDDPAQCYERAAGHAARGAGHLDQFGLAERATDWRGNNNIAESIIGQLAGEPQPEPAWVVCGAGTGGTSATIGRYLRYRGLRTRL